eukprot:5233864-Amphidinium_carterae.1
MEAWVREGWKRSKGNPLPTHRPWHTRMLAKVSHYWPLVLVFALFCTVMCFYVACCGEKPTEEDSQRRKDFETRLKDYETRLAAQKARKAKARAEE